MKTLSVVGAHPQFVKAVAVSGALGATVIQDVLVAAVQQREASAA